MKEVSCKALPLLPIPLRPGCCKSRLSFDTCNIDIVTEAFSAAQGCDPYHYKSRLKVLLFAVPKHVGVKDGNVAKYQKGSHPST